MTAKIIPFPTCGPFVVRVERVDDETYWLVIARNHAWAHSSFYRAMRDALRVAAGFGVMVKLVA
jgi:hypothetical protein